MTSPKVSVIVPVYNADKYLRRCIDSILSQTFADFELLLVDDGSTDGSPAICDAYAARDSRVRVFHKPNGGVSSARNLGLDNARGEWITFCDADDWVGKEYIRNLVIAFTDEAIDMVFNYAIVNRCGKIDKERYPKRLIALSDLPLLFLENDLIWHTSPWSKLFKRSVIEKWQICFPLGMHIGEDAVFLFSYMMKCNKIRVVCTCDYHYMIYPASSLTRRINSFASEYQGYKRILDIACQLQAMCKDYARELEAKFCWLVGGYQRRCLIALYHDKIHVHERRRFLKSQDFGCYLSGVREDSVQGKIYQSLLRCKFFFLYDLVRYTFSSLKRWNTLR